MVAPDEPVPLSADEVAALVRGEMSEERIEQILAAREVRVDAEQRERPEAPVEISDAELKALSSGREVEAVNKRIEELRRDRDEDSGVAGRRE